MWTIHAQTFTKLLELHSLDNILRDIEIDGDNMFISVNHFCDPDTSDNSTIACTGLYKLNQHGDLVNSILLDTLGPEGWNRLLFSMEKLYLTGHLHKSFEGRKTLIYKFNENLQIENLTYLSSGNEEIPNSEGILKIDDNFLLYGKIVLDGVSYYNVLKIDLNNNIIWDKVFKRGLLKNEIHDLQLTHDGNLLYLNEFSDSFGAQGESGLQIIKMDTDGNKLDSLEFSGIIAGTDSVPRLLASNSGDIYCYTFMHPEGSVISSHGHINKYSSNLDTLFWSLKLPINGVMNNRRYRIYDFMESENGDILACGTAYDAGPNAYIDTQDNSWNGFFIRVSPAGEIMNLRVYKMEHNNPLIPIDELGRYRESSLWNIRELTDGRIILGGTANYTPAQNNIIYPAEDVHSFTWIMTVNSDGCLDNEECQEVINLDGEIKQAQAIFPIGTKWTYDYFPFQYDPDIVVHSYITYEVTDTVTQNDTIIYTITNNRNLPEERMIQEENEVWFWDDGIDDWQLTYDFDAVSSYTTQTGNAPDFINNVEVKIDNIGIMFFGDRGVVSLQEVSMVESEFEEPIQLDILERCGNLDGGLRLGLGLNLFECTDCVGKIRCFEQDTFSFNFNESEEIACDSVWITILNATAETPDKVVSVFPNPSSGIVHIDGIEEDVEYKLFTLSGELVEKGGTVDKKLELGSPGVFLLGIRVGDQWSYSKIIKIE
jgi:hypothetical protein